MLLQRILTALVLLPLVVIGVLYLSTDRFALLLAGVILLAATEWSRLAALGTVVERLAFYLLLVAGMFAIHLLLQYPGIDLGLFAAASLGWLMVALAILRHDPEKSRVPGKASKMLLGLFVLLPTWAALVYLHGYGGQGPALVLYAMSLSWVADTGAYFAGKHWGRVKLAPKISPKKTREGVYGALVVVGLWSGLLLWFRPQTGSLVQILLFCLLLCLVSVIGDLFESLMKRQAGIKDSGRLFPGHGGILDRIDSLTAVAPVFVFGLLLLGGGE